MTCRANRHFVMKENNYLLLVALFGIITSADGTTRPNIVFILADDLGWDDVSFHGSTQIPTPNLDALAYDGIILNNYYVQPICTPSRAALLTGRHPIHTGMQHAVIYGSEGYGLPLKEKLLPEFLREQGYATHMVGKWHLGFMSWDYTPTHRGFQSHYGILTGKTDYWDHTQDESGGWGLDLRDNKTLVKDKFGVYSTNLYTARAVEIIESHNVSTPLFLYLPHQAPHNANGWKTLEAPWEYEKRFTHISNKKRRTFAGMVSVLDESVGNVTKALHGKGMLNNTIIVFSTDNGGPADGFSGNEACNWPLRGTKYTLWEGGVRGVGFLWSPLLKRSQYVSTHMMQIIDWLPTLLTAAGCDPSKVAGNLDGVDMWETLSENRGESPRTEILHNIDPITGEYGLRVNDMKLIFGQFSGKNGWYPRPGAESEVTRSSPGAAGPKASGKYRSLASKIPRHLFKTDLHGVLHSLGRVTHRRRPATIKCGPKPANWSRNCNVTQTPCLFNITTDPCEYVNLAAVMPDMVGKLTQVYLNYKATEIPPGNKPLVKRGLPQYHGNAWTPWVKDINGSDE